MLMEAHFHHWIINKKGYCDFLSQNSDFVLIIALLKLTILRKKVRIARKKSELRDINSQLWEIKSELRDINLQFWERISLFFPLETGL